MSELVPTIFEVEEKADDVFVGHLKDVELDGLQIVELLEAAAPVKDDKLDYQGVPRSAQKLVSQFGAVGVYEGMNTRILRAHRRAFAEAWPRAYVSAQMMRFCVEPLTNSQSMQGSSMYFPYDWCHLAHFTPDSVEELLEEIAEYDTHSGVSPKDHYLARVLGNSRYTCEDAGEWVHLRSSIADSPTTFFVPGSNRGWNNGLSIKPPTLEPKLVWREVDGQRVSIGNAEAGLETISEPTKLTYQDGTTGLIAAAVGLGVDKRWPKEHSFSPEQLPPKDVRKGTIPMESPQVPLLAQVSAGNILNHENFSELLL